MKIWIVLLALGLTACEESEPQTASQSAQAPSGNYSGGSSGGGGQVALGWDSNGAGSDVGSVKSQEISIANRYQMALDLIKKGDWDTARDQLLEALHKSAGTDLEREIQNHLKMVERGILSQPTHTTPEIFSTSDKFMHRKVSMRGLLIPGGPVGEVSYYFWLDSGKKIQCRYHKLPLQDKKKILQVREGSQVLVRGVLKPPWGSIEQPYLDLSYFRLEKHPE